MNFFKAAVFGLSVVEAGKGGRGGKHGNVNMDNERFVWQTPKCISHDSLCTTKTILNENSGVITFNNTDYENYKNVLYRIELGDKRKISLKFNKDHGFGMEYHNKCGYDKLHIFSGLADEFDSARRIARFCGPKNDGGKPWDGSRLLQNDDVDNVLPMWDEWYDTVSGNIFIGIDLDQDNDDFTGFELMWESEPSPYPDFNDVKTCIHEGMDLVEEDTWHSLNVRDNRRKRIIKAANGLRNKMNKRSKRNRKCQNQRFDTNVPTKYKNELQRLWGMQPSNERWEQTLLTLGKMMQYFVSDCKNAVRWPSKEKRNPKGRLHRIFKRRDNNLCSNANVNC